MFSVLWRGPRREQRLSCGCPFLQSLAVKTPLLFFASRWTCSAPKVRNHRSGSFSFITMIPCICRIFQAPRICKSLLPHGTAPDTSAPTVTPLSFDRRRRGSFWSVFTLRSRCSRPPSLKRLAHVQEALKLAVAFCTWKLSLALLSGRSRVYRTE